MTTDETNLWINKISLFCSKYDIPIEYLAEVMLDPKVIPMLRGKAFEYSVLIRLSSLLDKQWQVNKVPMNAQFELHDEDITVTHIETSTKIRLECKLAHKESYSCKNGSSIQVKCMRSRTLGDKRIKALAPKIGVTEDVLKIHNDQYRSTNFDFVVTSIGNAFYRTDKSTGLYEWMPTENEIQFLKYLSQSSSIDLTKSEEQKRFAFSKIYIAKSIDLAVNSKNSIICRRQKCMNKTNCNFIPNYPVIKFNLDTYKPYNPWYEIEDYSILFKEFVDRV